MAEQTCGNGGDEESQSDYVYDHICQPCKADGKYLEAEGRCEDCDEFLCKHCFLCHTVPSITRNHVLTSIGNLVQDKTSVTEKPDQCTQRCSRHTDEIIKYYCPSHQFLGCSACIIMEHKTCETIYIPSVAKGIMKDEEFKSASISRKYLTESAQQIAADAVQKLDSADLQESNVIDKIRKFRKDINNALDKAENDYIHKAEKENSESISNLKSTHQKCIDAEKEISDIFTRINVFEKRNQFCNMYIEFRKHQPTLKAIENTISELSAGNKSSPKLSRFKWDQSDVKAVEKAFCQTIDKAETELSELKQFKNIDIRTKTDAKTCWISGSFILLQQKVLVTDYANEKLKLIDVDKNKVMDEIVLPAGSRNIVRTGKCEVAAAIPSKHTIIFVCFDPEFKENRAFDVNGECHGLFYFNNKLAVSFKGPCKIVVMDMQGSSLQTIATNTDDNILLNEPIYVSANPKHKRMYISNAAGGFVVCLDYDGNFIAKYTDIKLKLPTAITIDSHGLIYVSDWNTNTVHQLTHECKKKRILLNCRTGVIKPYALCFDEENDLFYVGMRENDTITVFRAIYK